MTTERPVFGTLSLFEAMADALNSDPVWAEKGANITASMVYSYLPPIGKLFYLNFDHGKITEVAEPASEEEKPSDYVITGSPEAWRAVFQKELKPTTAMATGKLKVKGKQTYLLKNMAAFSYILEVMTGLDPVYD
jgi:putative sterol carrier protein